MPIHFLANRRRAQRLGRVRLGIKKTNEWGKEYPSATPYFVLKDAPALMEIYETQPTQLNIEFLWDDIHMTFPHYMRRYTSSGLRCLGDGDIILYRVNEAGDADVRDGNATEPTGKVVMGEDKQPIKVACPGDQCAYYVDGACKPTGFLRFLPVEAPRLGYYDMVCHQKAIIGIKGQLELAHALFHHITGIPFLLHRGSEERVPVKVPGKGMVDMPIRTQWIEIEPVWFAENFALRDKRRALAQAKVRQDVIDLFGEEETTDEVALVPTKIDEFKRPLFDGETGEILDDVDEAPLEDPANGDPQEEAKTFPTTDEPATPPTATVERPASPETVRAWLRQKASKQRDLAGPSSKALGLMVGTLEKILGGDDADKKRRTVLYSVWGVESAKDMSGAEVSAVLDWLDLEKDEGTGEYIPASIPVQECKAMHRQAVIDEGQLELDLGPMPPEQD